MAYMRLAQYLALTGLCSRKQAGRYITDGAITFDGQPAQHIDRIELAQAAQHDIRCHGQKVGLPESKSYWLFNKPVGVDCRLLEHDANSLLHLLPTSPRLFPVGRLDKDSRGLLLLTNDGALSHKLMHPDFYHHKTYQVQVNQAIDDNFIQQMSQGVAYKDVVTRPCQVRQLDTDQFEIVLTQGLNRQIRRMSQALGYHVIDLNRTDLMQLNLGELAMGEMRQLETAEVTSLWASLA